MKDWRMTDGEAQAWIEGYNKCALEGWELAKYYRLRPPSGFSKKSNDWIAGYLEGLEHAYLVNP
jgi:hypothetical protein